MAIYKGWMSLTDLSSKSGVNVTTLHERAKVRSIQGTYVGRMVFYSPAQQKKLLEMPRLGRPKMK